MNLDMIGLLGLIRMSMFTDATSMDTIHSLIDAMEHFYIFKQGHHFIERLANAKSGMPCCSHNPITRKSWVVLFDFLGEQSMTSW
jgi:hypothetical protein